MSKKSPRKRFSAQQGSFVPAKCWVGDSEKSIYKTREEAEVAALVAEHDYGVKLDVYKCEYGDHWHLTRKK